MYLAGAPVQDQIALVPFQVGVSVTDMADVPIVDLARMLITPFTLTVAASTHWLDETLAAMTEMASALRPVQVLASWHISVTPVLGPDAARISSDARARIV